MTMPYYVSPEQIMQDKAEYAKKGIARGRSIIAVGYDGGILLVADNPSSLSKISEIYDRIGFAGAGKYSEFENLRKGGIRHADIKGFLYSRNDVTAKSLANAYSQMLGTTFSQEMKPLEVEVLVVGVGDDPDHDEIYRISFDGSIFDERSFTVIGGRAEFLFSHLKANYRMGSLKEAMTLSIGTIRKENMPTEHSPNGMEVAILDRTQKGRTFRRIQKDELKQYLM